MYQSLERTGMIDLQRLHDDTVECSVFWAKTGEGSLTMERYVQGWFRYILPEYVEESKISFNRFKYFFFVSVTTTYLFPRFLYVFSVVLNVIV